MENLRNVVLQNTNSRIEVYISRMLIEYCYKDIAGFEEYVECAHRNGCEMR